MYKATHLLHNLILESHQLGPSRRPFSRHAAALHGSGHNTLQSWRTSWQQTPRPTQLAVNPDTTLPPGADLPRKVWVTLNRLRTGVGRFNANMYRWGLRPSAACTCGAKEQTAEHIIYECPTLRPPGNVDPTTPNPTTASWLQRLGESA